MKLYLTDHRFDQVHLKPELAIGSIKVQEILDNLPEGVEIVGDRHQADFAITHYGSSTLEQLNTSTNLEDYPDLQIFFCVTTDYKNGSIGYSEKEQQHQKKTFGNKTRYILYGRNLNDLNKPEILNKVLKAFLCLTDEQAGAIVEGNFDIIPKDLVRIFHVTKIETLVSLSVLCQGYLAVHPNTNLNKEVKTYLPIDVSPRIIKTENWEWWQKAFPSEKKDILIAKITEEWKSQELPQNVADLIDIIYSNQSIIEVKVVEEAYKAIVARLTSF